MALRFWRRMKIAPGLTLNLSKSGGSLSLGPRGAKYSLGSRGRRTSVGLPGTGIFYTQTSSRRGKGRRSGRRQPSAGASTAKGPAENRLTLGFFRRLVTPEGEKAFVDGCRELSQGHYAAALPHFEKAAHLTDGAFLAGFLRVKQGRAKEAIPLLKLAVRRHRQLGAYFGKYGLSLSLSLPITEEIEAHLGPSLRGALLALVEAGQLAEDWETAQASIQRLRKLEPRDVVIQLSLAELLWEANHGNRETCRYIVKLSREINNESPVHTNLLLYKAMALNGLEMHTAARDVLTRTLRRKKNRSPDLMNFVRYERARTYDLLGQSKRARSDLEKIYASDPGFEDVATRLLA